MSYLPRGLQSLLAKGGYDQAANPGLVLDKYSYSTEQEKQREPLERVIKAANVAQSAKVDPGLNVALRRRAYALEALRAKQVCLKLATPLALHLSRATALENAALSLHRTAGFPVIPGTGLKGLARAYAVAHGVPDEQVERVFGSQGGAGAVVFHDAWPVRWPSLALDIANNHHDNYYSHAEAPGDWENPVPITFLVVEPGAEFSFAVSPRAGVDDETVRLACDWLVGGLVELGAGAKTAVGYGVFEAPSRPNSQKVMSFQLRFVTPAFLAGANQKVEDATLRSASLKGLLRWWWRTLHVGALSAAELRDLEGHIFGDTRVGQARFDVVVRGRPRNVIPAWKTNGPGDALNYIAYGMAEVRGRRQRPARPWVSPGEAFTVEFRFRPPLRRPAASSRDVNKKLEYELTPEEIRDQVLSAAALLCRYGGIGAKNRKGFGSVDVPKELEEWTLERARAKARQLRERLGIPTGRGTGGALSLAQIVSTPLADRPIELRASDWRDAMTRVGEAYRQATKSLEKAEREALGLPRATRGVSWRSKHAGRHASPVHVSLKSAPGGYRVTVLPFVAQELPDEELSRRVLSKWCSEFEKALKAPPPAGGRPPATRSPHGGGSRPSQRGAPRSQRPAPSVSSSPGLPKVGELIEVTLVRNEKKQRWDAEFSFADKKRRGLIKNSNQIPADLRAGDQVRVKLAKNPPASPNDLWELEWVPG